MKRIYILALLAILICANGYSQQTSQEFADAMIEAGTEKNLNVKLQKIEKLLNLV